MARKFVFRIDSEGVKELEQQLQALGPAGQKAFDQIRAGAPQLASALTQATQAVDQAKARLEAANPGTGLAANLNTIEGRAKNAVSAFRDLAGAAELVGGGSSVVSQKVQALAGILGNVADTAATAAISFQSGIGSWIAAVARAHPVTAGLVAVVGAAGAAYALLSGRSQEAARATITYAEAVERLNARLADQAQLQRDQAVRQLAPEAEAIRARIQQIEASIDRARQSVATAEATYGRTQDPRAADRLEAARRQLEALTQAQSGPLATAREQLAAIDAQIRSIGTGLQAVGQQTGTAIGSLGQAVGAIASRVATPRERIDQTREASLLDLARARERGVFADPSYQGQSYQDLVTRVQREYNDAIREQTRLEAERARAAGRGAEERQRVTDAIQQQVRGIGGETRALEQNDRERAIATELQRAEETARRDTQRAVREGVDLGEQERRLIGQRTQLTRDETAAIIAAAGARYDQQQAQQQARRQAEAQQRETERAISRSTDRIVDFAADGFTRILERGVGTWRDLWNEYVSMARRAIAQAAAEAFVRPIVQPIVAQVVGQFGGMFGIGGGVGGQSVQIGGQSYVPQGGGGGGMPNLPSPSLLDNLFSGNLFSSNGGTLAPGLDLWAFRNLGFGQINSNFAGQAAGAMGPFAGGGAPGLFGGGGLGDALAGFSSFSNILGIAGAALPGIISGNYAQAGFGAGGAALGTLILPGIGTMIGGFLGNLVGGLFGKKTPPFHTSSQLFDITGNLIENNGGTGNAAFTQGAGQLGGAYFQALQRLQQAAGGTITGGPAMRFAQAGTDGQNPFWRALPNDQWYFGRGWADTDSAESALRIGLQQSIGRLQWQGVGRAANYVLQTEGGGDFDQLLQRLQQAVEFQKRYDAAIGDTGETLSQVEQQVKALNDQFDAMTTEAGGYGFAPSELDAARARALGKMRDSYDENVQSMILGIVDPQAAALAALDKERQTAVKDATLLGANINEVERLYGLRREAIVKQGLQNIDNALRAWLDAQVFGAASSSSPTTRLSAAQEQFAAQLAAARGGDATAAGSITTYADRLLTAGREYYASSESFAALEQMTRSQIIELGKALGLPGFARGTSYAPGGLAVVGENGPEIVRLPRGSQVMPNGAGAANDDVAALVGEVRRLTREFGRMMHVIALGR